MLYVEVSDLLKVNLVLLEVPNLSRIVEGTYRITPKKHVLRFDAIDDKSPITTLYIKTEAVQDLVGASPMVKIAVDVSKV